ncbi:MAG TPA: hypothetical protein VII02_01865 [Gemmatimonadaceae bacterium]
MLLRQFLAAAVVSTALTNCASAPPVSSAPQSVSDQSAAVYPTVKVWTGTLNPTQSYDATAAASKRQNGYGRVELTVSPNTTTLTHVILTVSIPLEPGMDLVGWGLSQGRCGSGNPLVLPPSMFPAIQLGSNGQGTINANIPFIIPDNGSYHVDVFRGSSTQLNDVITCASLRRES